MESKKFNELQPGDSIWVWWIDDISEYIVEEILPNDFGIDFRLTSIDDKGDRVSFGLSDDLKDFQSFTYGISGWFEYKICGTSKDAVMQHLKKCLERDEDTLIVKREEWLKKFEE